MIPICFVEQCCPKHPLQWLSNTAVEFKNEQTWQHCRCNAALGQLHSYWSSTGTRASTTAQPTCGVHETAYNAVADVDAGRFASPPARGVKDSSRQKGRVEVEVDVKGTASATAAARRCSALAMDSSCGAGLLALPYSVSPSPPSRPPRSEDEEMSSLQRCFLLLLLLEALLLSELSEAESC